MNWGWGGTKETMDDTLVSCLGLFEYRGRMVSGQLQSFTFKTTDEGPFYLSLSDRQTRKATINLGTFTEREMTCAEMVRQLKNHCNWRPIKRMVKEQLQNESRKMNLPITTRIEKQQTGWVGAAKGMHQILWERGFINPDPKNKKSIP